MKCEKCGSEVKEGVKFCGKCGSEILHHPQAFCNSCGTELKLGVKFCPGCGAKLENTLSGQVENDDSNNQALASKTNLDIKAPNNTETNNTQIQGTQTEQQGMTKKTLITIIVSTAAAITVMFFFAVIISTIVGKSQSDNDMNPTLLSGDEVVSTVASTTDEISVVAETTTTTTTSTTTTTTTTAALKIPVVDVTNMEYKDAIDILTSAGFTNITSDVDSSADNCRWVVVSQSVAAGEEILAEDNISLSCVKKCFLYLDITSDENLIFNKYSISVSLDGTVLGTVDNGGVITYMADIDCGEHTIEFVKSGSSSPKQTKILYVNENTTFTCRLLHNDSSIDINNESIEHNLNKASLEVVDVTNIPCSDARSKLKNVGFSNITTNPEYISSEYNWIVTSQSVAPGTRIDKNEAIQLGCVRGEDYFVDYIGKNANECEKMAEGTWYNIVFKKDTFTTYDLSLLSEKGKEDYIVSSVSYAGFNKELQLYLTYIGPTPVPTATPTPRPTASTTRTTSTTTSSRANFHSSNNYEIAKNGDSGVYAYSNYKPGNNAEYVIYLIIDFDEGYIYYFCEGNGDEICDRLEMDSGDLNSLLYFYYVYDEDDVDLYAVNFKWSRNPDHLILQDEYDNDWDYYPTDLNKALALRDSKEIIDYF